jgi:hypothetical protein
MKKLLFLVLALAAFLNVNSSCTYMDAVQGNGKIIKKELSDLRDFDGIANGIAADVIVTKGDNFKVEYEGDEKLLENLIIEVKNGNLDLRNKKDFGWNYSKNSKTVFYITMPSLKKIALGGSGDFLAKGDFKEDKIEVALGGSGDVKLNGFARKQDIAIGGSGNVDLSDMQGESAEVAIAGSGDVRVNVSEKLNIAIAGSGDVKYKGNPSVKQSIVGSGDVTQE